VTAWPHGCVDARRLESSRQLVQQLTVDWPDHPAGTGLLFVPPAVDAQALVAELACRYPDVHWFGASSSGALGAGINAAEAVSAVILPREEVEFEPVCFRFGPEEMEWPRVEAKTAAAIERLDRGGSSGAAKYRCLLMISGGLTEIEEYIVARVHSAFPDLPLIGGTSSDGLAFRETFVINEGRIVRQGHLLMALATSHALVPMQHHHFQPTEQRFVVTEMGNGPREVREFDGRPARQVYADAIGVSAAHLDLAQTSKWPLGIAVSDRYYIRSAMQFKGDVVRFACAVDRGSVLTLMRAGDLVDETRKWLAALPPVNSGIMFNCLARYLEMTQDGVLDEVGRLYRDLPLVGMHTYGEQFMGLHLNHTLTALLFAEDA